MIDVERWAQAMLDTDLESALVALEEEEDAYLLASKCPFEDGAPGCRCDERQPAFDALREKSSAIRREFGERYGLTTHQKMARIAAARAKQEVAPC